MRIDMGNNISEKVDLFLRRLEKYDFSSAQEMCTDKATVWQNDGEEEQAIGERLEQFRSFAATVDSMRYDVVRQFKNSDEIFQQQVLRLNMTDGSSNEIHALLYFRFEGDLIDRIEEYVYPMPTGNES
ncbi:nuclear transport factor 2 family protein [Streptomyces sp. NPDC001339]|uniref:nuclear transport factor 2 family protein n=1 Tax=Streptomyces sp. NPDC001339 TaxID=3364563 RepID=UPI0036C0DA63